MITNVDVVNATNVANTIFQDIFGYRPFNDNTTWTTSQCRCRDIDVPAYNNVYMPAIKSVIFNRKATIVYFQDGTKCIVRKSAMDEYNREHAVVYAIVKRAYGIVKPDGTVEGNGMGNMLSKVVANAFDQEAHERNENAKKAQKEIVKPWKVAPVTNKSQSRDKYGRFVKKANRK